MLHQTLRRVMLSAFIALAVDNMHAFNTVRHVFRADTVMVADTMLLMRMGIMHHHMVITVMPHHAVVADASRSYAIHFMNRPGSNANCSRTAVFRWGLCHGLFHA